MQSKEFIEKGETIGIFPEGTRNKSNAKLLKFRYGAVSIAKETNTLIVPFAIKGTYKIFRKNITLKYGKPLDVSNMELEEANEYLREKVFELLKND